MALRVISILILLALTVCASAAQAQEQTIQSSLFENCEEAERSFVKLTSEERSKLVDYLTRVVGLNTQAPAAPEVFAVLPNGRGMEPVPPALWQTTDAKRELRGKRCALILITIAGPLAFDTLPQLITLYSQQPLSDEIAVGIEETAASIAEQAHKNGQAPTNEVMDKVIPFLKSERPLVAQNFLHEYIALSLPRILTYLSALSEPEAAHVVSFLHDADPDGGRSMRALIDLVPRLPTENANRLAAHLPFPTKEATAPLISDFARLAAEPTNGTNLIALLGKGCVLLGGILIDPTISATVARNPQLLREGNLSEQEQQCLVRSIPAMANLLVSLITSSLEEEQNRGLELLPYAISQLDAERKNPLFVRIKELATQANATMREKAIQALSLFSDKRTDTNAILISILKTSLASKDPTTSTSIVDAACRSAIVLNNTKELARYGSYVMDALKRGISSPGVVELAAKIDSIEKSVVDLVGSGSSERGSHILTALKERKSLSKSSLSTIAEALRQPALSATAESLLLPQGPSTVPLLRKTLLKSSTSQRLGILALLEVFGSATKAERLELTNTLASSEACSQIHDHADALRTLLNASDPDHDLRQKLSAKVFSCLCTYEHHAGVSMLATSGRALLTDPNRIQTILTDKTCSYLEPELISATATEHLPGPIRSHILTQIIEKGTRASQVQLLESLSDKHPLAEQALPSVRALASSIRNDQELAFRAVLTLARLGDTQFEWSPFVRDTIDMPESNPNYKIALEVIKALPAETVLTEVSPALNSDNPERVAGACRVGATLGARAIPIVSKVWNLREKRSPPIKYAAILALLEINPLTPDLHHGLRAILVNRYFAAAYKRPIQWRQSVAIVDLDKASFGTLRTVHLERLLLK